jgi:DNA-binding winged helix-turn-helix (wHTH) protein/tetratricopeptide (TPR) repeat protein
VLSPDRWQIVERVFYEALALPALEREACVFTRCGHDAELLREVGTLLAAASDGDSAGSIAGYMPGAWAGEQPAARLQGRDVDQYRVISLLGEGGMGEVYLAEDRALGRRVALKLLPLPFSTDPSRLHRFGEEARATSALNHPNIITVYHLGEFEGRSFIAAEFIDGTTLRRRLIDGPLPIGDAIDVGAQIAAALAAAHDAGIIHRDIKPENVMIRRDGIVKVLDFGLAKLAPAEKLEQLREHSHDRHRLGTAAGAVLGTRDYMAPEQAAGRAVDARADLYSLGVVLHEMATGSRPADGAATPVPEALAGVIARALASDPDARHQSAREIEGDLEAARQILNQSAARNRPRRPAAQTGDAYEFGPFHIDAIGLRLWRHGHPVALSAQGCELLLALIEQRPEAVSSKAIAERVWPGTAARPRVRAAMQRLRRALDDDGRDRPRYLEAVAGRGYRFRADANVVDRGTWTRVLAILPFEQTGEGQPMSLGIAETLTARLCRVRHLVVRSPNAPQVGTDRQDLGGLAARLKVDFILDGRLEVRGDAMRLVLRLFSAADDTVRWAQQFDGSIADPFAFEDGVAASVAQALALKLSAGEGRALRRHDTDNVEARRLFTQGKQLLNLRTADAVTKATAVFARALEHDAEYAEACAGLAEAEILAAYYALQPPRQCFERARTSAERAVRLDPELGAAYTSLAIVAAKLDWSWDAATSLHEQALQLRASHAPSHYWYSMHLVAIGRFEEALAENQIAIDMDPLALQYCIIRGWMLPIAGRLDEGLRYFDENKEVLSRHGLGHMARGVVLVTAGRLAEAEQAFILANDLGIGLLGKALLGHIYARTQREDQARAILNELEEMTRQGGVSFEYPMQVHLGFRDDEAALSCLERCCDQRIFGTDMIAVHPWYAHLRPHPRFQALVKRLGLQHVKVPSQRN